MKIDQVGRLKLEKTVPINLPQFHPTPNKKAHAERRTFEHQKGAAIADV